MNILMFNYEYPPLGGGGGVVQQAVAEELAHDHRVCVITSAYTDLPRYEVVGGVEVHRVPVLGRDAEAVATLMSMLSYPPSAWARARSIMRSSSFDIVNGHFAIPTGPGSLPVARAARLPHVLSVHGGDLYDPSKKLSPHRVGLLRATVGSIMRASDSVVASSCNTVENARRFYGHEGPIDLIPLGIAMPSVPPADRIQLGLPDGFLAVTVGRLIPRKDLGTLLSAFAASEVPDAHLVLIGDGPERGGLERLADQLGITGRIHFCGRVDETRKLQILRAADAYASSSLHEGFGLVFLEAMAAGLPIVTTDNGGHTDFLADGANALMVPVGDAGALARAIATVRDRPAMAAEMRAANLSEVQRFDASRCASEYQRLFARVIETAAARRRGRAISAGSPGAVEDSGLRGR